MDLIEYVTNVQWLTKMQGIEPRVLSTPCAESHLNICFVSPNIYHQTLSIKIFLSLDCTPVSVNKNLMTVYLQKFVLYYDDVYKSMDFIEDVTNVYWPQKDYKGLTQWYLETLGQTLI